MALKLTNLGKGNVSTTKAHRVYKTALIGMTIQIVIFNPARICKFKAWIEDSRQARVQKNENESREGWTVMRVLG